MEILTKTSPAETHLLLEQNDAEFKELLKLTFVDLIRKGVLESIRITKQANKRDKPRTNNYIQAGPQFKTYSSLEHEKIYLSSFQKSPGIQILFRHVVTMGIENSKGFKKYRREVMRSPNLIPLIKTGFFSIIFGKIKLTKLGQDTQSNVKSYLKELELDIQRLTVKNQESSLKKLLEIQGNYYLLKNIDAEHLNKIDSALVKELNKQYRHSVDGYFDLDLWDTYELYSHSFDLGYESSGYDDSVGCDGDSGCGGCGCGGD